MQGGENGGDGIQMQGCPWPVMQMCFIHTGPDGDPSGIINVSQSPGFLRCMHAPQFHIFHVFICEAQHSHISYVAVTFKNEKF